LLVWGVVLGSSEFDGLQFNHCARELFWEVKVVTSVVNGRLRVQGCCGRFLASAVCKRLGADLGSPVYGGVDLDVYVMVPILEAKM
jgi:hypothetical protein